MGDNVTVCGYDYYMPCFNLQDIEISILLTCFCSFDLLCPLFDKDISIEILYIVLFCPIK